MRVVKLLPPLLLEIRPHSFDRVKLGCSWWQRLEMDAHFICKVDCFDRRMRSVVVKDHNTIISSNIGLDVSKEPLEVANISLVGNNVLKLLKLLGNTTYDSDRIAPGLVEPYVYESVLRHPEALHLLPEMC